MALGIMRNSVPLDQIYGAKGSSKAADVGCKQNGTDISNLLLALSDGKALGYNVGLAKNGSDMSSFFGQPTGNTPLPINGNSYVASASSGVTSSVASLTFLVNSSGWALNRVQTPGGGSDTPASGTNPTGATQVSFTLNATTNTGGITLGNSAPTRTAFSTTQTVSVQSNATPSSPEHEWSGSLTINFYNASNNIISTTVIYLSALAVGAS